MYVTAGTMFLTRYEGRRFLAATRLESTAASTSERGKPPPEGFCGADRSQEEVDKPEVQVFEPIWGKRRIVPSTPYLLLGSGFVGEGGDVVSGKTVNMSLFDPRKEETVTIKEHSIWPEVMGSRVIGASRGCIAFLNEENYGVHLWFNPCLPRLHHKVVSFPPLLPYSPSSDDAPALLRTNVVRNVSFGILEVDERDAHEAVVAVKFWGPRISFCRVCDSTLRGSLGYTRKDMCRGSIWEHTSTPMPQFNDSDVVYSMKDGYFLMSAPGSHSVGWHMLDLADYDKTAHCYRRLVIRDQPKLRLIESQMLLSCSMTQHLVVDTPTGASFCIHWYRKTTAWGEEDEEDLEERDVKQETVRFIVYKVDIDGNAFYTRDIGNLCIFLGKNEPFAVGERFHRGLKPNSIYFATPHEVGVYNLSTDTIHRFGDHLLHARPLFWLDPLELL